MNLRWFSLIWPSELLSSLFTFLPDLAERDVPGAIFSASLSSYNSITLTAFGLSTAFISWRAVLLLMVSIIVSMFLFSFLDSRIFLLLEKSRRASRPLVSTILDETWCYSVYPVALETWSLVFTPVMSFKVISDSSSCYLGASISLALFNLFISWSSPC